MKYVPNLIPNHSKILPEYFTGSIYSFKQSNKLLKFLSYFGAVFFFLLALVFIKYPLVALLFALLGFILLPQGHSWLEQKLHFQLTPKIKAALGATLFIGSFPLTQHYAESDKQEAFQLQLQQEAQQREKRLTEQREQLRKDSLNYYLQASATLEKSHKPEKALQQLDRAMAFTTTDIEKQEVVKERIDILAAKTIKLVKAGKYQAALPQLNDLLAEDRSNADLLYNRAICYSKIRKMQQAVTDLKTASGLGNEEAQRLHEKINPLKKRVSYYLTRCCDGSASPSNSKGRGACSHHGGVCNWNEPVYEEYRQYQ